MAGDRKRGGAKKPRAAGRTRAGAVAKGKASRPAPAGGGQVGFSGALEGVAAFASQPGVQAAVIGGVAVIARGVPRFTADIDVAVVPPSGGVAELLRRLARAGIEPRIDDAERFAEENLVVLARHRASGVDIDVSLAQLEFEQHAIRAAESLPFGGVRIRVPHPTDLVVYKMVAARPKDLEDIEALVIGGADVDAARVEALLRDFDELLGSDRAGEWRALWGRLSA